MIHLKKDKKKKSARKGMTVIEIVVSMLLMALAIIVMGRLTASRIIETESLTYQYTMQAAEGMLYGMYKDFHNCQDYTISHDVDLLNNVDVTTISFDLGAEGTHIYAFDQYTYTFYFNGASQLKCEDFTANGDMQHLYISMKLANGERLEYTIYS